MAHATQFRKHSLIDYFKYKRLQLIIQDQRYQARSHEEWLKQWEGREAEMAFEEGTKVRTNEEYFKRFNRVVYGTVKVHPNVPSPPEVTLVLWEKQEGQQIPVHTGNVVVMMTKDLVQIEGEK
jgi:hypothetical protein